MNPMRTLGLSFILMTLAGMLMAYAETKPTKKSPPPTMVPKTILDYKAELGLSDDQAERLRQAMTEFEKDMFRLRSKLQVSEVDLLDLLQKDAELNVIKAKLQESALLQADMRFATIEADRKIGAILTSEQAAKWQEMLRQSRGGKSVAAPKNVPPPKH